MIVVITLVVINSLVLLLVVGLAGFFLGRWFEKRRSNYDHGESWTEGYNAAMATAESGLPYVGGALVEVPVHTDMYFDDVEQSLRVVHPPDEEELRHAGSEQPSS